MFDDDQDAPTFSSRILNGPCLIQTVASCYKSALQNLTLQVSHTNFSCKRPDQSSPGKVMATNATFTSGLSACLISKQV